MLVPPRKKSLLILLSTAWAWEQGYCHAWVSRHGRTMRFGPGTTRLASSTNENGDALPATTTRTIKPAVILSPNLAAADANYRNVGPLTGGTFVVTRTGPPLAEELTNENIVKIVMGTTLDEASYDSTDLQVNTLLWKCLGYRFNGTAWQADETVIFPKWYAKHPTPPDCINMQRIYSKEIDQVSLRANQDLVKSIPLAYKQMLKPALQSLGFTGYQYSELTPNKTRRAQIANWLLYYREHLFGYTLEELRAAKVQDKEKAAASESQ
jgi:Domain of unknown function (DUF1823)